MYSFPAHGFVCFRADRGYSMLEPWPSSYMPGVPIGVQNVNARGTIYSMWIILRKCEGGCEARLVRSIEQIW